MSGLSWLLEERPLEDGDMSSFHTAWTGANLEHGRAFNCVVLHCTAVNGRSCKGFDRVLW